jgi:hypothetical protein
MWRPYITETDCCIAFAYRCFQVKDASHKTIHFMKESDSVNEYRYQRFVTQKAYHSISYHIISLTRIVRCRIGFFSIEMVEMLLIDVEKNARYQVASLLANLL